MNKGLTVTAIVLVVVLVGVWAFTYVNPGVYVRFKCNQGGDNKRKFYDPNWQARGAVCDGYYIPFGTKTLGKSKKDILAKMATLLPVPTNMKDMKTLAESAANLV